MEEKSLKSLKPYFFQGYRWFRIPGHPRSNNGYLKYSVLVLERKLGRPLESGELVHHIDENRLNDHPDNLEISDRSEHMSEHSPVCIRWGRQREYLAKRKRQVVRLWEMGWNKAQIIRRLRVGSSTVIKYVNSEGGLK